MTLQKAVLRSVWLQSRAPQETSQWSQQKVWGETGFTSEYQSFWFKSFKSSFFPMFPESYHPETSRHFQRIPRLRIMWIAFCRWRKDISYNFKDFAGLKDMYGGTGEPGTSLPFKKSSVNWFYSDPTSFRPPLPWKFNGNCMTVTDWVLESDYLSVISLGIETQPEFSVVNLKKKKKKPNMFSSPDPCHPVIVCRLQLSLFRATIYSYRNP